MGQKVNPIGLRLGITETGNQDGSRQKVEQLNLSLKIIKSENTLKKNFSMQVFLTSSLKEL
jgi:hypothetical protein